MATTLARLFATVRSILQDTSGSLSGFRYPDSELAMYASEAIAEARRVRPDLFIDSLDGSLPQWDGTDLTQTIPLSDMHAPALVNFIAGRAELRDDEFTKDGRAATLLSAWGAALVSNNGKR